MAWDPYALKGFLFLIVLIICGLFIYFAPFIIARNRNHAQLSAIFWLNFFSGWTFVGWLASMIWALTNPQVITHTSIGNRENYITVSGSKTCPMCAEDVKAAALICRFCGYNFPADSTPAVSSEEDGEYRSVQYQTSPDGTIFAIIDGYKCEWNSLVDFKLDMDQRSTEDAVGKVTSSQINRVNRHR